MADAFKFEIDHAQSRVERDRLFTQITGKFARHPLEGFRTDGWDMSQVLLDGNGDPTCWWEPITGKLMLCPLPLTKRWKEINTGAYARLQMAHFTFVDSSLWQDLNYSNEGSVAIETKSSATQNILATSVQSFNANQAFYFAPLFFGNASESRGYAECSFGGFGTGVDLRFYASGAVEVRKAGTIVAVTNWSGNSEVGSPQNATNQRVGFLILAAPPAQLIVVTTWGGGFSHIFDDLDPLTEGNAVLPAGNFYFRCNYMKTSVECAPLRFQSSGTAYSIKTYFKDTPEDTPTTSVIRATPGFGNQTYSVTLEPQGDLYNSYRFKVDMTAATTPVYPVGVGQLAAYYIGAVDAEYEVAIGQTSEDALDVTEYIESATLSAGMDPGSVKLDVTLKTAILRSDGTIDELDADGTRALLTQENRPFRLSLGELVVIDGICEPPVFDDSTDTHLQQVHFTIKDKVWKLLDEYRFTDPTAFDGYTLEESFEKILTASGNESGEYEIDDEAAGLNLVTSGGASQGDWAFQAMPRDTAAKIFMDLHEQYCGDWFVGSRPRADGPVFQVLSADSLGEAPELTLYPDYQQAVDEGETDPLGRVYSSYNERRIPVEVNQFFVHGLDTSTRRPIIVKWEDTESQDITPGPGSRPDNWTGTIRKGAINAPSLRSEAAVRACGDRLWKRLRYSRVVAEIDCAMLVHPDGYLLWVGDSVELVPHGVFRIQSVNIPIKFSESEDAQFAARRRAHYVLEKLVDQEDSRGLGHVKQTGLSVAEVFDETMKRMRKGIFDIEDMLRPVWKRVDAS